MLVSGLRQIFVAVEKPAVEIATEVASYKDFAVS
jgi:hypothetical protein